MSGDFVEDKDAADARAEIAGLRATVVELRGEISRLRDARDTAALSDEEKRRLWEAAWGAYVQQYNHFRDQNRDSWQAFFTAHHGTALDAALCAYDEAIAARSAGSENGDGTRPPGADVGKLQRELAELRSILGAPDGQPLAAWTRAFVDERNELTEESARTQAAHESAQQALINVERDRNAWKAAAGVDWRDLDISPAQAAARNAPRCLARSKRHSCWMIATHPGQVHWDMSQGWPQPWAVPDTSWRNVLLVPADRLQDAPEALRSMRHDCEGCAGAENCPVHDGPEWSDVHAEEGPEEP
jgi:hypothetical protein